MNNKTFNSKNKIQSLIDQGVIILDPNTTYIDDSCEIKKGTIIYPGVIINENVQINENCIIQAYSYIAKNVTLFNDVKIGQYTIIRDDTKIGAHSSIGPHCEITRSILGCYCLIGHKNFIGDAVLMDNVKFGANVIIANSNWEQRFKTFIGTNTKVGVNSTLIAPINIGENCFIAASVTLRQNIENNQFVKTKIEYQIKPNKLS